MHELTIATELVAAAIREAQKHNARRVQSLLCHVGTMQQIVPTMLTEAFALAAAGTLAEGASVEIRSILPRGLCRACGAEADQPEWTYICPRCGSHDLRVSGGEELVLASLVLELDDECGSDAQRVRAE
jgi:hydrogenase nickel incorporation protein HypA/HybF